MPSPVKEYLPRKFKTLAQLDRHRKLCLGLPVPLHRIDIFPWGYIIDPNNAEMVIADEKAMACLLKAKEYLAHSSYVDVSDWLTSCGYPISHEGLRKLFQERNPFKELALPLEERIKL